MVPGIWIVSHLNIKQIKVHYSDVSAIQIPTVPTYSVLNALGVHKNMMDSQIRATEKLCYVRKYTSVIKQVLLKY